MKNNWTTIIVAGIVLATAGFFGGMLYQKSKTPQLNRDRMIQGGFQGSQNSPRDGSTSMVRGKVISSDNESITVKLADNSSKIVLLSESTEITKSATGSASDLTDGVQVLVIGKENSDKSVTATNVQLNPVFRNNPGE